MDNTWDTIMDNTWDTWVAIYAALLSTVIGIWQWITNRPRISLKVSADIIAPPHISTMHTGSGHGYTFSGKGIDFIVRNRGSKTITIENASIFVYKNRIYKSFKIKDEVIAPVFIKSSDKILKPGLVWNAMIDQTHDLKAHINDKYVCVAIYCSYTDKPILKRIKRDT